jgi:hypothetical protein
VTKEERRRERRVELALPTRVEGWEPSGKPWIEVASTEDVSSGGVRLRLSKALWYGQLLRLSLPMPKHFRRYDPHDASYQFYGLVRYCNPFEEAYRVGVLFFGKHPPREAVKNPGGVFLMPGEQRRYERVDRRLRLRLQILDAPPGMPSQEQTVAENLSRWGAFVRTSLPVAKGDTLFVEGADGAIRTRAAVRSVMIGEDGVPRLSLLFLDGALPDELLTSSSGDGAPGG